MNKEEMIKNFREYDGNGFETATIETDDEGRWIVLETYFYNPGDSIIDDEPELTWRQVNEYVRMKLEKFIDMRKNHIHISNADEANDRPLDEIYDLTEEQAVKRFTELLDELPYISPDDITMDTPDRTYITKPF